MFKKIIAGATILAGACVGALLAGAQQPREGFSAHVGVAGELTLPENYQSTWTHLGSWAVAKKEGEPVGSMHDVYTQPGVVEQFQRSGEWPDGAVLVKQVRHAQAEKLSTGYAAWSGEPDIWFMMVKDTQGRFPENSNWGGGWGWALFNADDPTTNVSTNWRIDCMGCHVPARADDWIYLRGYRELREFAASPDE